VVSNQFDKIRVAGHDDDCIHLVGQLCCLDGERDVGAFMARAHRTVVVGVQTFLQLGRDLFTSFMARAHRTVVVGVQTFLQLGRDLFTFTEVHQSVQAAVSQQARYQGIEIQHGVLLVGL
jgi:hypothetical protein